MQGNTQKEIQMDKDYGKFNENELTKELQLVLDVLLKCKETICVTITLIKVLAEALNIDFSVELTKSIEANRLK
jgi:hypothetical protein